MRVLALAKELESSLESVLVRLLPPSELQALRTCLAALGLRVGDRVVFVMDNTSAHVGLLLLLMSERIAALLLAPESTAQERRSQLAAIGGCLVLEWSGTQLLSSAGRDGYHAPTLADLPNASEGIFLLTSGSTGRPNRTHRSIQSWRDEARRYCSLLNLRRDHRVLLATPLWHAYGLGWLWAVVQSDCALEVLRPTELGSIASALRTRATHCALTPAIASLLSQRAASCVHSAQLEVVMAGAGPVDASLDERFTAMFGVGLSRNYGSTESGALCAGLAPLPPLTVGALMPHLQFAGTSTTERKAPFVLKVQLEDGRIYDTGDLAVQTLEGWLKLVGREASAIRRGERWVSPFEIESVLNSHPAVRDVSVRGVRSSNAGNDHIFASVLLQDSATFDAAGLGAFCAEQLSRSKVPDRFENVPELRRNAQGKLFAPRTYQAAPAAALLDAAIAYKRSTLLFALLDTGVLESMDGSKTSDQLAWEHGLHADTLARALELAQWLGLVEEPGSSSRSSSVSRDTSARDIVLLEQQLCQSLNSTAGLARALREGHLAGREQARQDGKLARLYQSAMNGSHKRLSMTLIWRELRNYAARRPPFNVLDLSATDGGYSRWLHQRAQIDVKGSRYTPIGCLTSTKPDSIREVALEELQDCTLRFDVIVLDNATHHPEVVYRLPQLMELLAEGGYILVDEIFIEPDRPFAGIDWLTHGGMCLPVESDLLRAFETLDLVPVTRHCVSSAVSHHVILFKK